MRGSLRPRRLRTALSFSDPPFTIPAIDALPDEPSWFIWTPHREPFARVIPKGGEPFWFNPNDTVDPLNPFQGGRFHPLRSRADGRPIQTLYGAESLKAALCETVFHNVVATVAEGMLARYAHFEAAPRRDLRLIDLAQQGAARLRLSPEHLVFSFPSSYPQCRAVAQLLHARYPTADGLCWVSRRYAPARSFVLFGDRIGAAEFRLVAGPNGLDAAGTDGRRTVMQVIEEAAWDLTP
jgi:hypothetical protein